MLPGWGGVGMIADVVIPTLAFLQGAQDTVDRTVYTFSSQNFGAAAASRRMILGVMGVTQTGGKVISSATIGGVSAAIDKQQSKSAGTPDLVAGILSAAVPTGTSGNVVVTWSGACYNCGIVLYRATDLQSGSPYHTASDTDDVLNMSLNIPGGGIAVGVGIFANGAVTTGGLTEDYDATLESGNQLVAGSDSSMAAETGRAISFDGAAGVAAGVSVSWR